MEPAELVLELVLLDVHGEPHLALSAEAGRPTGPGAPAPATPAPAAAPVRDLPAGPVGTG